MNIALKYRPSSFKDLVGQDMLVRVLQNAFILNKIPHSILLSGSSGVGKTTTARIIALCLNCFSGPIYEPCETCESCIAIKKLNHPDVIEIDAASHTSIDDIKIVLEDICYLPVMSKFKVYIIDEVHMLSNSAFNALLKTLEEPPSNVKFILATTEIKKVPATIIARCQRFDLCNIQANKIVTHLENIVQEEDCSCEQGVLELIARYSENSMRNALFLLNQAILYSEDKIVSTKSVMTILGLVDRGIIFDLLQAILNSDLQRAVMLFNTGSNMINPLYILEDLLHSIQWVCRFLITGKIDSIITDYEASRVKELSVKKSIIFFSRLWKVLLKSIQDIKSSTCYDVAAEMVLINLCCLSDLPSPEQLIKKLLSQSQQQQCSDNNEYHFNEILNLLKCNGQIYLYKQLCNNLQLVSCRPGYIKLKAISKLDGSFYRDLTEYLNKISMHQWVVIIDNSNIENDYPAVRDIFNTFKGVKIIKVENKE